MADLDLRETRCAHSAPVQDPPLAAELPPTPLTVAHIIHSLGAGGAEAMLVELARAAPTAGIRMIVIGLSDAYSSGRVDNRTVTQLREYGATVYEIHASRFDPAPVLALAQLLRDEHVDVVHTHLKHADVIGGLASRLAHLPSVSTLHVIDLPTSRLHRLLVSVAVCARRHLSSTVITLSEAQQRWYREQAGVDAPITLLPNGVAQPTSTRSGAEIRAELGVPENTMLASCVSLMRPEKGHTELLEAIGRLSDDVPLIVAMAGDGPLLEPVRSAVECQPVLRDRVRVLGFRSDIADLLAASDFVIQPSLEDALPTALIFALAGGRPIVATNVGGIPDIVGPDCGLLVEAGCPAALSAGIAAMAATVISGGAGLARIHRATRKRYETRFNADVWVKELRAVYERTIRGCPRRIALVEFPPSGGLFQFSLQLGEALARAGRDVELITGPSPELTSREPGCRVRSILPTWHPTAGRHVPDWWRRARRFIRAGQHGAAWAVLLMHLWATRPDVVMWSAWRFPIDGWGVRLARKILPNSILALMAHEPRPLVEQPGEDGLYKTSRITAGALAGAFADLDVAFVLGESARQILTETWPITAPVHVIPCGDWGVLVAEAVPGAETTGPIVLAFGTITAYKGIDVLCEAWPTVRAQVPDAELIIVGALGADIDELNLRSQVAHLAGVSLDLGYVPVEDVSSYFAKARCVVLPYKRSSQSGVAHLAHTLARPVVATRVGDIPAVVRDEVSGLLVAPGDPEKLADAIVRLLTDRELARRMGDEGARSLAQGASWDDVAALLDRGLPFRRGHCGPPHRQWVPAP